MIVPVKVRVNVLTAAVIMLSLIYVACESQTQQPRKPIRPAKTVVRFVGNPSEDSPSFQITLEPSWQPKGTLYRKKTFTETDLPKFTSLSQGRLTIYATRSAPLDIINQVKRHQANFKKEHPELIKSLDFSSYHGAMILNKTRSGPGSTSTLPKVMIEATLLRGRTLVHFDCDFYSEPKVSDIIGFERIVRSFKLIAD